MNAVIYARYSSDNQREESIEGQLRECKEYADQNGITVVRTYIDRALSAKTDSRPQFQQMIHDSATHTFEAVLVWKLDRFSRNRYDSAHYKRILKNNRVHVVSVTEPISNTPEGIMLESLLEGMAEYYSAELAEKVSRGHKENALKAKFNGGPVPLGYRIDSEHHYQIDPTTAPVVQEAFHRYAAGESIRSIIESLNARSIRNSRGNPFTKNSFQTLLKNRRYLGEYRYKDTVIPDAIPAIIDPDCFDAVQRRCEIHRQAPAHNKADVHYLLTTKLFCGKCGTMMAGESGRSHTGTVHCYYKCGTRKRGGKEACSLKPVRKEPLEQFVVKTALEKVLNDRVIDLLADKLLEYQSKENTRLPVLQAELKEVKRRIDNLVAAIEQGILTPSTKARMEELEQQREALETSILQEQIEKPPITREQILFWFDQFRHGDPADIAFQEKVIDCFVNSIYLFDDRIVVNFNYQEGGRPVSLEEVLSSFLDGNGAPKKALRKRKAFFIMIAALCECFRFAADFNPSQRLFLFCKRNGGIYAAANKSKQQNYFLKTQAFTSLVIWRRQSRANYIRRGEDCQNKLSKSLMAVCWYNTNRSGFAQLWMICIRLIVRGFKEKQAVAGGPCRQTGGFLYTAPAGGISLGGTSGCDAINNVMLAVAKLQDSNFTGRKISACVCQRKLPLTLCVQFR